MGRSWIKIVVETVLGLAVTVQVLVLPIHGTSMQVHLKTTGCVHKCAQASSNSICNSSILINGREYSHQQNGFNIVIIDNKSGRIQTHHLNYFTKDSKRNPRRRLLPTATHFRRVFANVTSPFTIIVALQNICSQFQKHWSTLIQKAGIKIMPAPELQNNPNIALVIGCRGTCPDWSNNSFLHNYSHNVEGSEISFNISINGTSDILTEEHGNIVPGSTRKDKFAAKGSTKTHKHIGTVLGGIIAVVFAICFAVILYVTNKRAVGDVNKSLLCWNTNGEEITPEQTRKGDNVKNLSETEKPLRGEESTIEAVDLPNQHQIQQQEYKKQSQKVHEQFHKAHSYRPHTPRSPLSPNAQPQSDVLERIEISPHVGKGEIQSSSYHTEMSSESADNLFYHSPPSWNRQYSCNITSVSSLVNTNHHTSDPILPPPQPVVTGYSPVADAFLSNKEKTRRRSSSSRRKTRRHSTKNHQRQNSGIEINESSSDVVSNHHHQDTQ